MAKDTKDKNKKLKPVSSGAPLDFAEIGASGTEINNGYINEEYSPTWQDQQRILTVEEMRRSDASVKAGLNLLKTPILSTKYKIDGPVSDYNLFIERNLFGLTRRSWKELLREICAHFEFGFYVFERVLKVEDGLVCLKDIAPRIPKSIEKFTTIDGKPGITQNIYGDQIQKTGMSQISIPADRLLIFTNEKEGDDITGQSLLRPAYRHWYAKSVLYKIAEISCERYGTGIPKIKLPTGTGEAEKAKAVELAKRIKSNEEAYIVHIGDMEIEILVPQGSPKDGQINNLITHHNRMILLSMLAQGLDLGGGDTGSYALSTNNRADLIKFAEDKLLYITDVLNKNICRFLIDINFGPQPEQNYPRLIFEPLGDVSGPEYAGALSQLITSGLVVPTPEVIKFIHAQYDLPKIDDDYFRDKELEELDAKAAALDAEDSASEDTFATMFNEPEEGPEVPIEEEAAA